MDIREYHGSRSWLFSRCFYRSAILYIHVYQPTCPRILNLMGPVIDAQHQCHRSYCKLHHSHRFSLLSILTSLIYDFTITWRLLTKLDCKLRTRASWQFNYNKTDNMCSLVVFRYLEEAFLNRAMCGGLFLFSLAAGLNATRCPSPESCTIVNQSTSEHSGRPDLQFVRNGKLCCLVEVKTRRVCLSDGKDALDMDGPVYFLYGDRGILRIMSLII